MKQQQDLTTGRMPEQRFFVPERAPFLELRTTLNSTLPYAEHFHTAFSLGLILQGKTRFSVMNTFYLAEQGDIVLIPQGRAHSCNPVDGPRSYHMLLIEGDWLWQRIPQHLERCHPLIKDEVLFPKVKAVMEAILSDVDTATVLLTECLLELYRRHSPAVVQGTVQPYLRPDLRPDLPPVDDTPPSVTSLAKDAGMRRESFSRAVHKKTGLPPSQYLQCLRLEKARRLLRQGKSIAEAALASGYTDQSHFHRMFVRFCAVTPGRYRRNMSHLYKK